MIHVFFTGQTGRGPDRPSAFAFLIQAADGKPLAQDAKVFSSNETPLQCGLIALQWALRPVERLHLAGQIIGPLTISSDCNAAIQALSARNIVMPDYHSRQAQLECLRLVGRLMDYGFVFSWRWVPEAENPARPLLEQIITL